MKEILYKINSSPNESKSNATTPGDRIKQYRIQKRLSLRKLAKEPGIDPGTLAMREKGVRAMQRTLKK